jgi:hypothetical protein
MQLDTGPRFLFASILGIGKSWGIWVQFMDYDKPQLLANIGQYNRLLPWKKTCYHLSVLSP